MSRRRLIITTSILLSIGYLWLLWNLFSPDKGPLIVCPSQLIFHIPCPGCGATRTCIHILKADIHFDTFFNPNGFLILAAMLVASAGLFLDLFFGKNVLKNLYLNIDNLLKKKHFWIPFAIMESIILVCNICFLP